MSNTPLFSLDRDFVQQYAEKKPPFGFNGLGELVYLRTYSRLKDDGVQEQYHETIERVVNGTYRMQQRHIESQHLGWDAEKAQQSAQEMYDRMWSMKFLPPGRGLWAMGSALTEERGLYAALNNCAFVSTDNIKKELAEPFTFLMDASMLGIGVGFDTKGAGQINIQPIPSPVQFFEDGNNTIINTDIDLDHTKFVVPDTREGWVQSLKVLLESYFIKNRKPVIFDYSEVRPEGLPIRGFGGVSSGPVPLMKMHERIRIVLDRRSKSENTAITITDITDIMNLIGKCVVAGNVRRTAEIAFGDPDSQEFIDLKNPTVNPERNDFNTGWGWTSNNSVFARIGMDYRGVAERVAINGEPGFAWLPNMQDFSRMMDKRDYKDKRVKGGNPCLEQSLESHELCCLVESFPHKHESLEDYLRTLKFAYLYAKTVTLGNTPWPKTNRVLLRNRRIGLSQSGIQQAIAKFGIEQYRILCEEGYETVQHYDKIYSEWFAIPRSVKTTSIKPSGSVSLLAGATPGMHWPENKTYIRRMRLSKTSALIPAMIEAGYPVEDTFGDPSSCVVEIPVKIDEDIRTVSEVSIWEQLAMAAFLQKYWADNQVSSTVTFDPKTEANQIAPALNYYQYQLKGISFLPRYEAGAFKQMPYESCSDEEYKRRLDLLKPLDFGKTNEKAESERFCDSSGCVIV